MATSTRQQLLEQGLALLLRHGYHDLGREVRYTVGPAVRQEILDRLLELNQERYAEEVKAGLHDKKGRARSTQDGEPDALFDVDDPLDETEE